MSVDAKVPLLASASGTGAGVPHTLWRPQMQTFLMRHGIEDRDYAREIAQWRELASTVEADAEAEEQEAIRLVLAAGGGSSCSTASSASSNSVPPAATVKKEVAAAPVADDQQKAKKRVADLIGRSRKAYGFLFAALPTDVRQLVADVPQGYAYGIWSFLEKKFRNTEQDSVMALWERLSTLSQDGQESFDAYKARVDSVIELLVNAKQTPPPGLYAALLLWRLQPRYATAVLTLKTGDRLKDAAAIDWPAIVEYMGQYERSQIGLAGVDPAVDRALALRSKLGMNHGGQALGGKKSASNIECYNCHKLGHYAAECQQPDRRHKEQNKEGQWKRQGKNNLKSADPKATRTPKASSAASDSDSDDAPSGATGKPSRRTGTQSGAAGGEQANMLRVLNRFTGLSLEPTEEDQHQQSGSLSLPLSHAPASSRRSYLARVLVGLASPALNQMESNSPEQKPAEKKKVTFGPKTEATTKEAIRRAPPASSTPLDVALRTTARAVDSGATVSITGNKNTLVDMRRCMPMPIAMADKSIVSAVYKGDMPMRLPLADKPGEYVCLTIRDVYYHERIDANLLSWGCMREDGWEMHSTKEGTFLVTPQGRLINASTRGRLTILNTAESERAYAGRMGRFVCTSAEDLALLHQRVGHASWRRLVKMCRSGVTAGIGDIQSMSPAEIQRAEKLVTECSACAEGKQHRNKLGHRGLDHGSQPGEVLHMDTFYVTMRDPHTSQRYRQYCLLATDGFTEMRWMAQTTTLYDLQAEAIHVMLSSRTLSGRSPRLVVTDLGSEFENNKVATYCKEHGIHLQPTPPRAKELNGVAEKSVDTVKNHVRAMLLASKVPDQIGWARATAHHVFLWNRTHIGRNTGKTPREAVTGQEPSILHVGVFGCDAFVHQDRTQRDTTFSPKAEPGIYLGHDSRLNCPVVRMLHTGKILRVKDVLFREGSFRHMQAELQGSTDQVGSLDLSATELPMEASGSGSELERKNDQDSFKLNQSEHTDTDGQSSIPGREVSESEPELRDSESNETNKRRYRVKSITEKRMTPGGQVEYRVKWVGHSAATWEPADTIEEDAPEAVKDYSTFVERMSEARVTRSRAHAQTKPAAASAPTAAAAAAGAPAAGADRVPAASKSSSTSPTEAARLVAAQCL